MDIVYKNPSSKPAVSLKADMDSTTIPSLPKMADETTDFPCLQPPDEVEERRACKALDPSGFFIRHPPTPHYLNDFNTPDDLLFQTIHMGAAVVDPHDWILTIGGLVQRPFAVSLDQLRRLPEKTITAFHECYGSPVNPPTKNVWRIGNVVWTGVPLHTLLACARPLPNAAFVWSEGLDSGSFAGVEADRYEKDLPIDKALSEEVLVAYEMNGEPLTKERGGPVRLVVPGWFGTNMTKWLYKVSLQSTRAKGPFTTTFYNEVDPMDPAGRKKRPVWAVEVNSIITRPVPNMVIDKSGLTVEGWAWSHDSVKSVGVSIDKGESWIEAKVGQRKDFSWQRFSVVLQPPLGSHYIMARATSQSGVHQPLQGRRNHVHSVQVTVQ